MVNRYRQVPFEKGFHAQCLRWRHESPAGLMNVFEGVGSVDGLVMPPLWWNAGGTRGQKIGSNTLGDDGQIVSLKS